MDEIIVISTDAETNNNLLDIISNYRLSILPFNAEIIDRIYSSPPVMLIINKKDAPSDFLDIIREDPIFSHLPVIALLDKEDFIEDWKRYPIDDFIFKPLNGHELLLRIGLCVHRSRRIVEINPLTMLPGNTPIIKEVQRRLDRSEEFALAYCDLDNFKPYNDKYGFSRGDEVIRMSGRLITNIVKLQDPEHCFVGHIGGDDFVFIVSIEKAATVCEEIVKNFDCIIPSFYDPVDRERGYITSVDRQGQERIFPFLSISIGVTLNKGWFKHYGAISAAATEVKNVAKRLQGSAFFIDRRKYKPKD
jgi:diguanylate cyclase (GGDEF)-like protein